MPSKNRIKTYVENGFYHVYNRGVEKRTIFLDNQDYLVFLSFLKNYLSPLAETKPHPVVTVTGSGPVRLRPLKNFFNNVSLHTYCLMPNHFHFLISQVAADGMPHFMQALCTSYSMYFNKKYNRVGPLFQGVYKAIHVMEDSYLLHLSRYIHLNPLELTGSGPVGYKTYEFSSYSYYLGKKHAEWINPQPILAFFKTQQRTGLKDFLSYQSFVEDFVEDPREMLGSLTID